MDCINFFNELISDLLERKPQVELNTEIYRSILNNHYHNFLNIKICRKDIRNFEVICNDINNTPDWCSASMPLLVDILIQPEGFSHSMTYMKLYAKHASDVVEVGYVTIDGRYVPYAGIHLNSNQVFVNGTTVNNTIPKQKIDHDEIKKWAIFQYLKNRKINHGHLEDIDNYRIIYYLANVRSFVEISKDLMRRGLYHFGELSRVLVESEFMEATKKDYPFVDYKDYISVTDEDALKWAIEYVDDYTGNFD